VSLARSVFQLLLIRRGAGPPQAATIEAMNTSSTGGGREALLGNPIAEQPEVPKAASVMAAERSLAQLEQTQRVAADTERLGMTIMGQLSDQRGQLVDAIERREEAHSALTVSSRLIRQMHRRATWIKISLCLIITGLMTAVMVIVYFHWLKPDDKHGSPPSNYRALSEAVAPSPPPPAFVQALESRPLGPGVVTLVVVGICFIMMCCLAYPQGLVVRTGVIALTTLLYAVLATTLLLIPRDAAPGMDDDSGDDDGFFLIQRATLLICSVLFCLGAIGCVMVSHFTVPQKAPVVNDFAKPDDFEPFRMKP